MRDRFGGRDSDVVLIGLRTCPAKRRALLAQLRVITAANVLKRRTSKFGLQVKQWTLRQGSSIGFYLRPNPRLSAFYAGINKRTGPAKFLVMLFCDSRGVNAAYRSASRE